MTGISTSGDVLAEIELKADNLDLVPVLRNLGQGASNAKQLTALYQPVAHVPVNGGHLYLSGVTGNYASVPNEAALNISGDLDIIVKASLPAGVTTRFSQKWAGGTARSRTFAYNGIALTFSWSADGVGTNSTSSANLSPSEALSWIRVTLDADNGAGQNVVSFYTSTDGNVWSLLSSHTASGVAVIANIGTTRETIGDIYSGLSHEIQRCIVKDGIDGTPVLDIDFSKAPHAATSFTPTVGGTVTINQSGNDPATIVRRPFLRFDGVNSTMSGLFDSTITGGTFFMVARGRARSWQRLYT